MKQRLIDANKLLEELRELCRQDAENAKEFQLLQMAIRIVHEQPTIDAEPVRHGNDQSTTGMCTVGVHAVK